MTTRNHSRYRCRRRFGRRTSVREKSAGLRKTLGTDANYRAVFRRSQPTSSRRRRSEERRVYVRNVEVTEAGKRGLVNTEAPSED